MNIEASELLQDVHVHLDRLSKELRAAEQSREATSLLNQELRNQLSAMQQQLRSVSSERDLLQAQIQQLSEQVNRVERLVMGVFEGRIWRLLSFLGSPLKPFISRK
jgi:predicted  nucleic acid-binding Zn-ribbon protein